MNSLVRAYLDQNKVLISYVRDVYGFLKGVVLATSASNFGFSLVHPRCDVTWKMLGPNQIPAIQRVLEAEGITPLDIFESKAYQSLKARSFHIPVPNFNRDIGLMFAIESAKRGDITIKDGVQVMADHVPLDKDLVRTLNGAIRRAVKYYIPA